MQVLRLIYKILGKTLCGVVDDFITFHTNKREFDNLYKCLNVDKLKSNEAINVLRKGALSTTYSSA